MVKVIPSILTNSPREAIDKLAKLEIVTHQVQIDIIDGLFVNNQTIDPSVLSIAKTTLALDFHLMTNEPIDWVDRCIQARAKRIIAQIENMSDQMAFINKVKKFGLDVGLALNIDTPVENIKAEALANLDTVLLMSYPAGFGGQPFNKKVLEKVKRLLELKQTNNYHYTIGIDGGVSEENIKSIILAGVGEVTVGSRLFMGDLADNIRKLSI
jgi:ribulose-phosphate 3-epimerase